MDCASVFTTLTALRKICFFIAIWNICKVLAKKYTELSTKNMRILHIDTEKGFRGGEQQLLWLAEGLKRKGIMTAVATVNDKLLQRCNQKKIETHLLSGNQILDCIKLSKIAKGYDIIHAHAAKAHTISAIAKLFNKKPLIYTRRVDYKPSSDPITKFKYLSSDRVVCVSNAVKEVIKNYVSVNEKQLTVIHSTTNPEIENNLNYEKISQIKKRFKGKFIIGSAAALSEQKNIPNFIKAAHILKNRIKNAVFLVAGDGHLKSKLQRMINQKDLSDDFFLVGFKKDIENYIKAFDIFILSSDFEGFSGSLLNAMILRTPVISTDAGGAKEVIINNKTGILIPKRNPKVLAESIFHLYSNASLREHLRENAYKVVKEKFSAEKMVEKYIIVYEGMLKNKDKLLS